MTRTSPIISIGIGYNAAIKQDSIPSMVDLQPFVKISDLRTDCATNRPYATYEPDFWLLDGQYKFLPDNLAALHVGIMNQIQSDGSSLWASAPTLTITFSKDQTAEGLTLYFAEYSNDYVNSLDIRWYDASDVQIGSTYLGTPTSWWFYVDQAVENFRKIIIRFYSTNKPYRYLRLRGIDYGQMLTFQGNEIMEANVIEEAIPFAIEARANSFEVQIYSAAAQFSPINPGGDYNSLTERQPIAVSEQIGNQYTFIGQYYLEKWENVSDTEIKFSCTDILGIIDKIMCKGGIWLGDGIQVEDLLYDLLDSAGIPYDLEASLYGTVIHGWLPICTYREALQQIAFAIGAYLDSSRDRPLKIYPTVLASDNPDIDFVITKAHKGMDQNVTLRPLVTGVEVISHDIIYAGGSIELYNGTLAAGDHEIDFKQPCHGLLVTGATISESGANYAILHVVTTGAVTLNGLAYTDCRKKHAVYNAVLPTSVLPNIIKIEDASLVNSYNADTIAQKLYDYYQQRLIQEARLYASAAATGDVLSIDSLHSKQIRAIVEGMQTNLTGGMIQQVNAVGVAI